MMNPGLVDQPVRHVPMTWEEYLGLPANPKAEWVDGVAVISPTFETLAHGQAVAQVLNALFDALPDLEVLGRCGVVLPGNRLRTPDITVVGSLDEGDWVEQVPVLVVEVLSRSSWSEDMVVKSTEYARAGVGQYWTVDPDDRNLEVDENVGGLWRARLRLSDSNPTGEVRVGEYGVVRLDLRTILRA